MSLRARLAAAFALVTLLPLVVLAVVVVTVLPARAAEAELVQVRGARDLAAQQLEATCRRVRAGAGSIAESARTPAELQQAAAVTVDGDLVEQVVVVDAAGAPVAAVPQGTTVDAPDADCLRAPGEPSGLVLGAARVREGPGYRISVADVVGDDEARAWARLSGGADVTVLAGEAVVATTLDDVAAARLAALAARVPAEGAEVDGTLLAVTPAVPGLPQVLVSSRPDEPDGLVRAATIGAVLAGVPLLAALLGWTLAGAITRPLSSLVATAREVEQGKLDARVEVSGDDEVGRLGDAFASMRDRLRDQVEELRRSGEELRRGLARLGATLSGSHDLERISEVALTTAVEALRARAGAVLLLGGDGRLTTTSARGLQELGGDPHLELEPGEGRAGAVVAAARTLLLPAPEGRTAPPPAPGEPDGGTALLVPLVARGEVVGVLALHGRRDGGVFGEEDLAVVRTFAGQAATAVLNVRLHHEAQRLSLTDALTGLHNYRHLVAELTREVERSARFSRPMAVLLMDLDRFKVVNDTYGHPRGDRVLRELADRLRQEVREVDTVARYGGEEVVVVLPETGDGGARQAAERLRSAVARRPFGLAGDEPVPVTVSIGIALYPQHGESADDLLAAADAALYAAKSAGRDAWRTARGPVREGRTPPGPAGAH